MSRPSPAPWPTSFVVKNGSKMRPWISRDAGAVVDNSNQHAVAFHVASHLDAAADRDGVQRVVDQVYPHLVEFGAHRMRAGQIVGQVQAHLHRLRAGLCAEHREGVRPLCHAECPPAQASGRRPCR